MNLLKHVQKNGASPYRVVDWKKSETHEKDQLVIQVVGKGIFFPLSPAEIVSDDLLLLGFSPLDVKTIVALHFISTSPKYKIKYVDLQ